MHVMAAADCNDSYRLSRQLQTVRLITWLITLLFNNFPKGFTDIKVGLLAAGPTDLYIYVSEVAISHHDCVIPKMYLGLLAPLFSSYFLQKCLPYRMLSVKCTVS